MSLVRTLADELIQQHTAQAAAVLERLGSSEAVELLSRAEPTRAAEVLRLLSPPLAHAVLEELPPAVAGPILDGVPVPTAAILLRVLEPDPREAILDEMDRDRVRGIAALLQHPPGSAGALMDPLVLALPQDATVGEALARVREHAENARYNLYVVSRERLLVGVLNLRELLLAEPDVLLSDIMVREPSSIPAHADTAAVLTHAGWRVVHALPVVDTDGVYLGAIRYRTLRRLEGELRASRRDDDDTSAALGALFAAGASGLLDAVAGPPPSVGGGSR